VGFIVIIVGTALKVAVNKSNKKRIVT